jgi:hypothetical protein
MIRTGHISARVQFLVQLSPHDHLLDVFTYTPLNQSLPERVSLFPFPTYSVRTPLQITNLLYSEVKKQPVQVVCNLFHCQKISLIHLVSSQNELISFDEFSIAATQLTNDGERLVWWYLLENRADSVERRKKLDIAEGRVAAAVE